MVSGCPSGDTCHEIMSGRLVGKFVCLLGVDTDWFFLLHHRVFARVWPCAAFSSVDGTATITFTAAVCPVVGDDFGLALFSKCHCF